MTRAIVLAEALGGSEEGFRATDDREGPPAWHDLDGFRNASGLPNNEQVTTARDMARLASALLRDFPHYYPVFSVQSYPYRGDRWRTTIACWVSYAGADGLKTGYTNASGFKSRDVGHARQSPADRRGDGWQTAPSSATA